MDCLFRVKTVTLETANVTNCHVIATDILFLSSNHRSVQFLYLAASQDRESIRNEVRACIREELNNSQGTQTLVNRTRNLIRESASFAARNLSDSGSVQPLPQNQNSKSKRPLPGHPLRFG